MVNLLNAKNQMDSQKRTIDPKNILEGKRPRREAKRFEFDESHGYEAGYLDNLIDDESCSSFDESESVESDPEQVSSDYEGGESEESEDFVEESDESDEIGEPNSSLEDVLNSADFEAEDDEEEEED